MSGAADPDNEEAETGSSHCRAEEIEGMFRTRRRRQCLEPDRQRNQAERKIDREQPRPRTDSENARGDRRSQTKGGCDHHGVVAEATALQPRRKHEADQRGIHGHHAAGAETLQRTRNQQARQRPGQRAAERGQSEQQEAAEIDALMADDLTERAERQHGGDDDDLIDIDDPNDLGRADMQIGRHRRQRDVGDHGVERAHRQRREDGGDRPAALARRQAVPRFGAGRWFRSQGVHRIKIGRSK